MSVIRSKLICVILIGLGFIISAYLLYYHIVFIGAETAKGIDICSALFGTGCEETLRSPAAVQLGIPLAGWGVVYYITLATLLILGSLLRGSFEFQATLVALVLSLVACLGSIALLVMMLSNLAPFCPLCTAIHIINLLLVIPLKRMTNRPISQLLQALAEGSKYLVKGKTEDPAQARWKLLGFLTTILVAIVIYQWVLIEFRPRKESNRVSQEVLTEFQSLTPQEIPVDFKDYRLGPSDAPVQLVVFSDFQCPGCKEFAQQVPNLLERFEGKLQIIFKHFPLGTACNSYLETDLHPKACEAAWAAEAAHQQGKFWAFHDALYASDMSYDQNTVNLITEELRLDIKRFEADKSLEATKTKVKSDVEQAIRLGVFYTPAIFLDGRYVLDLRPGVLEFLIAKELQQVANK